MYMYETYTVKHRQPNPDSVSGISLSHASAKTESENNRCVAQGTVTDLHPAAQLLG